MEETAIAMPLVGPSVVPGVNVGGAVNSELMLVGARAIDVEGVDSARAGGVTIDHARYAGDELQIVQHIAAVESDIVELFAADQVGALAGIRLQLDLADVGGDGHRFGGRSDHDYEFARVEFVGGA